MDANERVINRLERLYSLFGASDQVDSVVSMGGHAYRQDIRQAACRFLNTYLQDNPRVVTDSEVDLVTGPREEVHPIAPEQLRVFPADADIPKDALNARIDQEFVPLAKVTPPSEGEFQAWRNLLLAKVRQQSFHHFPERISPAMALETDATGITRLSTEPAISIRCRAVRRPAGRAERIWVVASSSDVNAAPPAWLAQHSKQQDAIYICEPRGVGASQWTRKNPPNFVERCHYLLGRTVDSGRVWDLAATARHLRAQHGGEAEVFLAGEGAAGVWAIYAALLEPEVAGLVVSQLPATHMADGAPALLNVLRVCDIPEALGLVAPRPITLLGGAPDWTQRTAALYRSAGAADKLLLRP
jgi:hypothetical protein